MISTVIIFPAIASVNLLILPLWNSVGIITDFPNLHPLVTHFPIVLLIITLVFQLFAFFRHRQLLGKLAWILLTAACVSAFMAAKWLHPHTENLPERAALVFINHEFYSNITLWFSTLALLLMTLNKFWLKGKFWIEVVITILLFISTGAVLVTGHYGAQLVHIEGVGPQGKYLEPKENH